MIIQLVVNIKQDFLMKTPKVKDIKTNYIRSLVC